MSKTNNKDAFVPIKHAAVRLGVPAAWLRTEAEAGRLPCLRAGRRLLIHLETLERALLNRASETGGEGVGDAE